MTGSRSAGETGIRKATSASIHALFILIWVTSYRTFRHRDRCQPRPMSSAICSLSVSVTRNGVARQFTGISPPQPTHRPSTASRYRCWLKNHVEPKWRDYPIGRIKPPLVEDWLKKLNLAPKSKSHLKNLMRVLFNAAIRWELIPYQHNPMSLVHVRDSSKRLREPKALSMDEFRKVLESIPEPFRTMCIVAMCLGYE
jgi:integrase